ncbi:MULTISPECIES: chromosome segregation protein SMC [unclassified Sedimentibacter]|uniref:chromosome segregation protein SMC n=1 Tax=unclassified Sedimentibacter TaxID=2649220 RepID=UPI0027E03B8A|nr:chromosome segregation protein SMC [Sedimentibacter sp. MB35-C1]WMJ76296.1 chromosome segregation protein SMC [Sedimentibacter sp. MB35-C1]
MYLKKVYINGFKSFAEKTEIIVEKGITAVVGPNGSGKSNISDAVKWVLGEQSAKSLRGGKMDDIIFAGTEKRLPLGYAEVNLIFDNESGDIPLEYKEVSIKRKLYKTGESEYYINKQQCRLKDVKELFMDTGIGSEGYSFIGQGRVEDILSPNSDTRRKVFEEASGIVKYKTRKEESERKLAKTSDNLDRVEDIVHELEERILPLSEQSIKARKYIELKESLKQFELNYLAHEFEKHSEQLKGLQNQRSIAIEQKINMQKKRDALQEQIAKQKELITEMQSEIKALESSKDSKSKEYDDCQSLCRVHKEKKLLYESNIDNVKTEISEIEKRSSELSENSAKLAEEKKLLEDSLHNDMEKFNSMNEEIQSYKNEIDKIIQSIEKQKTELFELHKEINGLNSRRSTIESFILNDNERIENFLSEISSEEDEKQGMLETIRLTESEQSKISEEISEKKLMLENAEKNLGESETDKEKLASDISKINENISSYKSKMNVLSNMESYYDGYYKSIKTVMNNKKKVPVLSSVLGTVADIIKTEKRFETAVEVALGSSIQNIIVNTGKEAEDIIEYLKKNKIGRVTFLPINNLQQRSLNKSEREILEDDHVINTGDMLVKTEAKFQPVIKHLLGRILIVDNLNNGFKISKRMGNSIKIVTLQGDVINAGGSVTGGHISNNQNFLGRKREIEECRQMIVKESSLLKENISEHDRLLADIKRLNVSISEIKGDISDKNNSLRMNISKIEMLREQAGKTTAAIKRYSEEMKYIEEEKEKYENDLRDITRQTESLKVLVKEKESSIEQTVTLNDANKTKYEEYNDIILKQRDSVTGITQEIKLKEEKINNIEAEIIRNKESRFTKEENLKNILNEINSAESAVQEYSQKADGLSKEISVLSENFTKKKESLERLQNEIYEYQNKINDANKAITDILDDENKMNVRIERETSKTEEITAKLWEDYELNYAMALKYKDDSISQTKIYSEVNSLKRSIKNLGNVNLDSIEEYEEVKERYDFLKSQQKDLSDAKEQLNQVIKELENQMRDRFAEEFANIRIKFNDVFKKLFNGGNGDVYLEDEADALNSNIEIAVQPPGKKLSKISLLSGGEKSLTAIALLFAILKTKPTPFCVLDEIEAALDDANINRFAQYLKEFSEGTQFIVITHRKGTMECADTLYGATMEEKGVTKLVSMKLSDAVYE